jgi:hypothetical protein
VEQVGDRGGMTEALQEEYGDEIDLQRDSRMRYRRYRLRWEIQEL